LPSAGPPRRAEAAPRPAAIATASRRASKKRRGQRGAGNHGGTVEWLTGARFAGCAIVARREERSECRVSIRKMFRRAWTSALFFACFVVPGAAAANRQATVLAEEQQARAICGSCHAFPPP